MGPRLAAADLAGRSAGWMSRRLGRGSGGTVRGRVTLRIAPDALAQAAGGRPVMLVSGTNGKSTTTAMIAAALEDGVVTNTSGANMPFGITPYLLDLRDAPAVLEVDELYLPGVARATDPEWLVLLNLTRDTLDRMTEVGAVTRRWREFLGSSDARCVANAADPNVVFAVGEREAVWVDAGPSSWRADSLVCPRCGWLLDRSDNYWSCSCGLAQPVAHYTVRSGALHGPSGVVPLDLRLPGDMNLANAAHAVAAAEQWGARADAAVGRIAVIESVEGRYSTIRLGSRPAQLLLAKNPAGWASALPLVSPDQPVIVGLNAHDVDGLDTSWIWDVPFERFAGRTVGVTGENRHDLAVRLKCAGAHPLVDDDPVRLAGMLPPGPLTALANYTAFTALWRAYT